MGTKNLLSNNISFTRNPTATNLFDILFLNFVDYTLKTQISERKTLLRKILSKNSLKFKLEEVLEYF